MKELLFEEDKSPCIKRLHSRAKHHLKVTITIYEKWCRFKSWLQIIRQILKKVENVLHLGVSSVSPNNIFDAPRGVINTNKRTPLRDHVTMRHSCRKMFFLGRGKLPLPWASGLPVAIQWQSSVSALRPQCTLECHWRNASVLPVVFQWSSSGFPVVFQCVPIMQINTGSPLGHHWVQASASVVPVASQCTCGSSGLPVCSNYAN